VAPLSRLPLAAMRAAVIETLADSRRGQRRAQDDRTGTDTMTASMPKGRKMGARQISLPVKLGIAAMMALTLAGCGGGNRRAKLAMAASSVNQIGVNAYLWRASLDALSFMPMLQTDSAGGVIVTDWYTNPANPGERMKVSVTILDQDLRADALRVSASRQVADGGNWVNAPVQAATIQRLEDIILTKARDLRRNAVGG
jgi:hypothetical protein